VVVCWTNGEVKTFNKATSIDVDVDVEMLYER